MDGLFSSYAHLHTSISNLDDGDAARGQVDVDDGLTVLADGRADLHAVEGVGGDSNGTKLRPRVSGTSLSSPLLTAANSLVSISMISFIVDINDINDGFYFGAWVGRGKDALSGNRTDALTVAPAHGVVVGVDRFEVEAEVVGAARDVRRKNIRG